MITIKIKQILHIVSETRSKELRKKSRVQLVQKNHIEVLKSKKASSTPGILLNIKITIKSTIFGMCWTPIVFCCSSNMESNYSFKTKCSISYICC